MTMPSMTMTEPMTSGASIDDDAAMTMAKLMTSGVGIDDDGQASNV